MDVRYLGVCCGAGPHHIRSIAEALGRTPPASRYSPDMSRHSFYGTDPAIKPRYQEMAAELEAVPVGAARAQVGWGAAQPAAGRRRPTPGPAFGSAVAWPIPAGVAVALPSFACQGRPRHSDVNRRPPSLEPCGARRPVSDRAAEGHAHRP